MPTQPKLAILLPALGLAQIVSWGSLFYSIAVLAQPIGAELHLSRVEVFAGFSLALAISGLLSPWAGRLIDARDGRFVLCRGALVGATALAILAAAHSYAVFLCGWCLAGIAMSMTLYDPAFATLGQLAGERYRRALTGLTLIAGFSSTVYWPLTHALARSIGWRSTLLTFAALHVVVALPLIAVLVPRPVRASRGPSPVKRDMQPTARSPAAFWLAACFALAAFVFSSMSAHLVGVLEFKGFSTTQAVGLLALIGPMQVASRLLEITFGRRFSVAAVGVFALTLLTSALVLLLYVHGIGATAWLFVIGYGSANGLITIVRGVLPAVLFGRDGLGGLLGWLARPSFVAQAIAPATVAGLLMSGSPQVVIATAAGAIALALGCLVLAVRAARAS